MEAEGVLGEIQNLKQRFKQQRENMGQQKQQKAVDELKMGVQNWHSDRANPSLKARSRNSFHIRSYVSQELKLSFAQLFRRSSIFLRELRRSVMVP